MSGVRINAPNILDLVHREHDHTRRSSTGTAFNGGVTILSRYLRPSLSSCHDFCKFGVERTLEIKARGSLGAPKRRKSLPFRLKSFPTSKTQKHEIPILDGVVSPLTTEESAFSEQVSPPVKDIEVSVIHVDDSKMKPSNDLKLKPSDDPKVKPAEDPKMKPLRLNQSSRRIQGCPNTDGQMKVETSKEMGNLSTNSPRASGSRRRSKAKRNKEVRKPLVPPSISSSPKHSSKKASGRNAENSNNVKRVSHFKNKKTVRKPKPERPSCEDVPQKPLKPKLEPPSWEDVPEKTLHVVEPNAEAKTPEPLTNVTCVTDLSPPSYPSSEDKSSEQASKSVTDLYPPSFPSSEYKSSGQYPKGIHTAQQSASSIKRNLRCSQSGIPASNSPPPRPPSAKKNLRRVQSGIQATNNSLTSCPAFSKKNLRRTQSGVQAANNLPTSCPPFSKKNLRLTQRGIQAANNLPTSCPPFSKKNLRRTQRGIQAANSTAKQNNQANNLSSSCPPSPRKKGSRGTQLGTRTSSLASLNKYSAASSERGETDAENQTSDLKREYKNGPRKSGSLSSKDDHITGEKMTFRRGKVVDPLPEVSTSTRLKFRRSVLGVGQNGKDDASTKTPVKKIAITAELHPLPGNTNSTCSENRTPSAQSRLSWPPSPKNTQPGNRTSRSYSFSLASMSAQSDVSFLVGETDIERQISVTKPRKDGASTSKDEQSQGQKLTFRRGKVVELPLVDSTPTRLKFKKRVLGGEADAGRHTVDKNEAIASQLSLLSAKQNLRQSQKVQSSRLSWPPSTKREGLRGTELELGNPITRSYSCTSSLELLSMNGDETDAENKISDLENETKNMREMDGTASSSKDECDEIQKLTFRRGKVVDIIHSEDSAPRRLKFKVREGLISEDNNQNDQTSDVGRKVAGKAEANDNSTETETKDNTSKHQKDADGKKSRSLFNNVIEETVSELVKARKSKVKALVGAFETVISLQDSKPVVSTSN